MVAVAYEKPVERVLRVRQQFQRQVAVLQARHVLPDAVEGPALEGATVLMARRVGAESAHTAAAAAPQWAAARPMLDAWEKVVDPLAPPVWR